MGIIITIYFFVLGVVLGSFYNVVGFRLATEKSIVKPRSHCMNCGHVLAWYELIPIFSYLFLKGKCKSCGQKISVFYPTMELLSGILFALSFHYFSFSIDLLIALSLSSYFIIICVTDLNYYIIPDSVTTFFGIVIMILNFFKFGATGAAEHLLYGLIMFVFMYALGLFGKVAFKKESLGGGDIKLLFVLGMCMPIGMSFVGVFLASFIALIPALVLLFKKKSTVIAFGPFLLGSFLILFLSRINLDYILNVLY